MRSQALLLLRTIDASMLQQRSLEVNCWRWVRAQRSPESRADALLVFTLHLNAMLRTQLRAAARPALRRPVANPTAPARFLATAPPPPAASGLRSFLYSSLLVLGTGAFLVYAHDSRAGVHRYVVASSLKDPRLPRAHHADGLSCRPLWP
jgi:hypothetical protein